MGRIGIGALTVLGLLAAALPASAQASANQEAYYRYDETAGTTAADSSGNNFTGNHQVGVQFSAAGDCAPVPPGNTQSYIFPKSAATGGTAPLLGQGAHVSTPNNATLSFTGSFSLSIWIKPVAYTAGENPNDWGSIFHKWNYANPPGTFNGYGVHRQGLDGRLRFDTGNTMERNTLVSAGAAPVGAWTHLVFIHEAALKRIFINGVQDANTSVPTATQALAASTFNLQIGKDDYWRNFYGNVDEVRLFSIAISPAEVSILHAGMPTPTPFTATAGPNNVTVTWGAVAGADGYTLERSPDGVNWTAVPGATSPYTDAAATFPGTYYYRVRATGLMDSAWATANASPNSITPRTNDHEEGIGDCSCGSSVGAPLPWAPALIALVLPFLGRRRI
jgi:hypothetical protein